MLLRVRWREDLSRWRTLPAHGNDNDGIRVCASERARAFEHAATTVVFLTSGASRLSFFVADYEDTEEPFGHLIPVV